jgi:predicted PurR-regulated permease PerM
MIDKVLKLPVYVKATIILIGIFVLFKMMYIAQDIIIPLIFSLIFAIVLQPVVNFLVRMRINRIVAIVITLFLTFAIIAGMGALIYSQANLFSESWPVLVEKFTTVLNQSITWISGYFDLSPQKINDWIEKTKVELISIGSSSIGKVLVNIGGQLVVLFLVPVYIFMILFYQPLLLDFIRRVFSQSNHSRVNEVLTQTKVLIQRYLIGLLIEFTLIAILNSVGLLILGIDYAILLGIVGALLNVIPYIGGVIGVFLFMIIALITKSPVYVVYVIVLYSIIQLIDNNYIVPKIVASKVKINALVSIIVVIAGNVLWGISGMFLSIPLLAIIKLILDHLEPLKPWGFLLGDSMPPILKIKPVFKNKILFDAIKKRFKKNMVSP